MNEALKSVDGSLHRKRIKPILAVGTSLAFTIGAAGQILASDPLYFPETSIEFVTQDDCPPSPGYAKINAREILTSEKPFVPINFRDSEKFIKEQARINGLTLFDWENVSQQIEASNSEEEVLVAVNDFFNNYSVIVDFPQHKAIETIDMPYQPANKENIELDKFKFGWEIYIELFSRIPNEVIQFSGLQKISLVNVDDHNDTNNAGLANGRNHQIFLDLDYFLNYPAPEYLPHELGHLIDDKICGRWGSRNDSEYSSLNPSNFMYGVTRDEKREFVYRNYGTSSVYEDKATLYENLLIGFIQYANSSPTLQAKTELLITRLEQNIPNIAQYLDSISRSHNEGSIPVSR